MDAEEDILDAVDIVDQSNSLIPDTSPSSKSKKGKTGSKSTAKVKKDI